MKKIIKKVVIILVLLSITLQMNLCYAESIINADEYKPTIDVGTTLFSKAGIIVAIIRNVGIILSVIALMIIGLRSMVGSIEEKSAYKESLPGYLLGVFLVFSITTIPSIIYSIVKNM